MSVDKPIATVPADPWAALRRHTPARIGLGRAGTSLPTHEVLGFAAAHAQARDAVHVSLDVATLAHDLHADAWRTVTVASRAPNREAYLRRPDWGRRLDDASAASLGELAVTPAADLVIVVADGLSAVATQRHAAAVLNALRWQLQGEPGGSPMMTIAPIVIATQARVALADEVGALLHARLALILLGERPGLSSPDSLGAYLTLGPRVGRTDAERNCVSNIRPAGLAPQEAARKIAWLVREALRLNATGISLKDHSDQALIGGPELGVPIAGLGQNQSA